MVRRTAFFGNLVGKLETLSRAEYTKRSVTDSRGYLFECT